VLSIQVFEISSLQIFTPQELDYLLCGRRELWKVFFTQMYFYLLQQNVNYLGYVINLFCFLQTETLADHIKFDHGYTAKSPAIVNV